MGGIGDGIGDGIGGSGGRNNGLSGEDDDSGSDATPSP
jgi:hypothetical protein